MAVSDEDEGDLYCSDFLISIPDCDFKLERVEVLEANCKFVPSEVVTKPLVCLHLAVVEFGEEVEFLNKRGDTVVLRGWS